jgi:hypothetical protein
MNSPNRRCKGSGRRDCGWDFNAPYCAQPFVAIGTVMLYIGAEDRVARRPR